MLFSFRQNISTFCLQNSDFIGGFSIRPAWDAYCIGIPQSVALGCSFLNFLYIALIRKIDQYFLYVFSLKIEMKKAVK